MEQIKAFILKTGAAELVLLGVAIIFVIKLIVTVYQLVSAARAMKKEMRAQLKMYQDNKCKGPHSWVDVPVNGEKTHVCKDCYYTPKYDSFVDKVMFEAELSKMDFDKNFEKFKAERFEEIAEKFGIPETGLVSEMYEELANIKKEFSIKEMDKFIAELLKKDE